METLTENDYTFLCKKTKLSRENLLKLIEDRADFNLLIETISGGCQLRTLAKLSFPLKSRVILYNKTKDYDLSLIEKAYVADAIAQYYPEILQKNVIRMKPRKSGNTEEQCRYFLILYGLHPKKAREIFRKEHLQWIESGFINHKQVDVGRHTQIWLKVMESIEAAGLFINACPNISLTQKIETSGRLNNCLEETVNH
jgi:hypothetical protein